MTLARAPASPKVALGVFPTAVEPIAAAPALWIKRDDASSPLYGGNKVRKLEHLLGRAVARGKRRIVTMGAAGSHHVLATAVHARALGLAVTAVLTAQPRTDHAAANLRAGLALGVDAVPAWIGSLPLHVLCNWSPDAEIVPLGGSSALGSLGYVEAAAELATQIRAGLCPEPELCVVAAGSGGTAAGLAVGLAREGLKTRVVGVAVAKPVAVVAGLTRWLTARTARLAGVDPAAALERLEIDGGWVGAGYGWATAEGDRATKEAAELGIALEATYTAKAFAAALSLARRGTSTLFWHTLSSAPMAPFLEGAPLERAIDPTLRSRLVAP